MNQTIVDSSHWTQTRAETENLNGKNINGNHPPVKEASDWLRMLWNPLRMVLTPPCEDNAAQVSSALLKNGPRGLVSCMFQFHIVPSSFYFLNEKKN